MGRPVKRKSKSTKPTESAKQPTKTEEIPTKAPENNTETTRKLTKKQQLFVDAYDGNATSAAITAGYSKRSARSIGAENLTRPHVIKAIDDRASKHRSDIIADRKRRQAFWSGIMEGEIKDDVVVGSGESRQAIQIPQKMMNRLKASELLGRSEGDFLDRQELSLPVETKEALRALSVFRDGLNMAFTHLPDDVKKEIVQFMKEQDATEETKGDNQ